MAAIILAIAGNALLGFRNTEVLSENYSKTEHMVRVLDALADLRNKFLDLETGQRGYVLSGDESFLYPFHSAISTWSEARDNLEVLLLDNQSQLARLSELVPVLLERIEIAQHIVAIRRKQGFDAAMKILVEEEEKKIMDRIRIRLAEMETEEKRLLVEGQVETRRNYLIAVGSHIAMALIALGLLYVAWWFRKREIAIERTTATILRNQKELFRVTLQSIGDGLLATDAKGQVSMMNRIAEDSTGWQENEAKGRPINEVFKLIDEVTRESLEDPVSIVLATGEIHGLANHSVLVAKDGAERPIADSAAPIKNEEDDIIGVVFVFRDISESERTKRQLEISEARYKALVDASAQIVWTTNAEGEVIDELESWEKFTGQVFQQYKAWGWLNSIHDEDRDKVREQWSTQINHPGTFETEYRLKSVDGEFRYTKVRAAPVLDSQGAVREWVGMNIDITEARLASMKLFESETRFRQIAQMAGDWIWEQEPSGRYLYCSPVVKEILGYSPQEMVGKHYLEFRDIDSQKQTSGYLDEAADRRKERFFRTINYYRHKNGHIIITESSGEPIISDEGEILKWRGVDRDITERREADERFQAIIESAPIGILAINENGVIKLINSFAEKLLGFNRDELLDKAVEILIPERFRKSHVPQREHYFDDPKPRPMGAGRELSAVTKLGEEIRVEVALTPIQTSKGSVAVAMITDIRERLNAEDELRSINRNQNNFLAYLGHELRNPLMPLRNAVELMKEHPPENAQSAWAMGVIERQLSDLQRLVEDLLDIHRIAQGKISVTRELVDIDSIIERSIEATDTLIKSKNQQLIVSKQDRGGSVYGDLRRLTQVLTNLLNNASKYSENGGKIWLTASDDGQTLSVKVRDEGKGIDAKNAAHIFDLFASFDDSNATREAGLGLGLALAQRIIKLHQGTIQCVSEGRDKGCEFTMSIPSLQNQENSDGGQLVRSEPKKDRITACRVLVVDDYPNAAESMSNLLTSKGYDVDFAVTGTEALRKVSILNPDIILLDLDLPDMSGFSVANDLRSASQPYNGHLIALSGFQQEGLRSRAREVGFDEFLIKPIEIRSLIAIMNDLLANRESDNYQ